MFRIAITDKNGERTTKEFAKSELSIGRLPSNDLVLDGAKISKRHARIIYNYSKKAFVVSDNRSSNGTTVNGDLVKRPRELEDGDKVYIGDYIIEVMPGSLPPQDRTATGQKRSERVAFDSAGSGTSMVANDELEAELARQKEAKRAENEAAQAAAFAAGFGQEVDDEDWDDFDEDFDADAAYAGAVESPVAAPAEVSQEAGAADESMSDWETDPAPNVQAPASDSDGVDDWDDEWDQNGFDVAQADEPFADELFAEAPPGDESLADEPLADEPQAAEGAAAVAQLSRHQSPAQGRRARTPRGDQKKASLRAVGRQAQQAALVDCLRRYVAVSERYQGISFGQPCPCGTCLLCRAKAALAGLEGAS